MGRYENTKTNRQRYTEEEHAGIRNGEFRKYQTTVYDKVPEDNSDIYVIAQEGDRLDNLAWEYYSDPTLWWIIARANNIGKGTLFPEVGIQLRIPNDTLKFINEYDALNKKED